jgi:arylsulfatase A-like enzyme
MAQNRIISKLLQILGFSALSAIVCGIVLAAFLDWEYARSGFYSVFFVDSLQIRFNQSFFYILIIVFLYIFIFHALNRFITNVNVATFLATATAGLPFFLVLSYYINRLYLPLFFEFQSILWNTLLICAFCISSFLVSRIFDKWFRSHQTIFLTFLGPSLILLFNLIGLVHSNTQSPKSPNVIFILVDCLRADHLGSYGYHRATSPHLDRFAKDSVLFRQAISQSTFTKTSMASIMTGQYPYEHGVYRGNKENPDESITSDVLSLRENTLAEELLKMGVLTSGWIEQAHLTASSGFAQGFVRYRERQGKITKMNARFLKWASQIGRHHQFFTYLHYIDLHRPYKPKSPFDSRFGVYRKIDSGKYSDWQASLEKQIPNLDKSDLLQLAALYDGLIAMIDQEIGNLFEELKTLGLYDNSLIIVTSDHGEAFLEHGFLAHSNTPYEELIRVPLIIKFPSSQFKGSIIDRQVRHIDLLPTLLDYLGKKSSSSSGASLLRLLENPSANFPQFAVSEFEETIALRSQNSKYIRFNDTKAEFYDLIHDPDEKKNLMNSRQTETGNFREIAAKIIFLRSKNVGKEVTVDEKTVEELKALGYLD